MYKFPCIDLYLIHDIAEGKNKPECGCDKLGPISQLVDHISNGLGFGCFVNKFFCLQMRKRGFRDHSDMTIMTKKRCSPFCTLDQVPDRSRQTSKMERGHISAQGRIFILC